MTWAIPPKLPYGDAILEALDQLACLRFAGPRIRSWKRTSATAIT
jgi:hypothetical protein